MLKTKNYCISKTNILMHELIGLNACITNSFDQNKIGLKGKIIDESRNTFSFETRQGIKVIPKKEVCIEFDLNEEKIEVEGEKLLFRPEDRIKALWRKKA